MLAVLLLALAAQPTAGTRGLATFGVKADVADFFNATLQKELRERGVELTLSPDADVPGKVAQCGSQPCAFVIRGTLAQLGDKTRLELELVGSDGMRIARHSAVAADPAALADQVPPLAEQLAAEIKAAGPVTVSSQPVEKVEPKVEKPADQPAPAEATSTATATPAPAKPKVGLWLAPLLASAVFLGAGGGCFAVAQSDHDSLVSGGHLLVPQYSYADAKAIADHGNLFQSLGWVGMGLAGAAAITTLVLWYVTRSAP